MKLFKQNEKRGRLTLLYATITVLLIIVFQVYWLYVTYQNQKEQVYKECEFALEGSVLNVNAFVYYTSMSLSNEEEQDKMQPNQKVVDSLIAHPKMAKVNRQLLEQVKLNLNEQAPGLRYSIAYNILGESGIYPAGATTSNYVTPVVYSKMDKGVNYKIYLLNLNHYIFNRIKPQIIAMLFYLAICIGAVALLVHTTQKAGRLLRMKEDFTNNMTHELKTPLSTLLVATEALDKYNVLDDKTVAREYIQLMHADLQRLSGMAESILYNAKLSAGKIHLSPTTQNLHALLEKVLANFKLRIVQSEAVVDINIPGNLQVKADTDHISNVFSNIIDNALKYTSATPHLSITAFAEKDMVKLYFKDNGIGIPAEHHKNIFKPYYRVSEGDLHKVKGYGLGLSYSYEIVALHHGELKVLASEINDGTTFEIKLSAV